MQEHRALPALDLTISSRSTAVEIGVSGEIDAANVDLLCSALDALDDAPKLVIDLSATGFVDVAGLRALAMCARQRRARGQALLVLRPPESVESMLRMSSICTDLRWVPRRRRMSTSGGS
ncbi:MAG: STAS domain-containing protein [Actinomycetota bacterium]